jgi:hypothetical protein
MNKEEQRIAKNSKEEQRRAKMDKFLDSLDILDIM